MEDLVHNIDGCIHGNVGGFFEKYFETAKWTSLARKHSDLLPDMRIDLRSSLWDWLQIIQSKYPDKLRSWHATSIDSTGLSSPSLHPDFYLTRSVLPASPDELLWTHVQAIGNVGDEHAGTYRENFLRLCRQAQQVFKVQPTRIFLHGFLVHGGRMEPWVFDRGGIYTGDPFDLGRDQNRLTIYLSGFQLMDSTELGNNTLVRTDATGLYILSNESDAGSPDRLDLEDTPIMSSDQIVGSGIAVYRAKRVSAKHWEFAVKLKWNLPETGPVRWPGEERMLRLVKERSVWGVARLSDCHYLESVDVLRKGLRFEAPRELLGTEGQTYESPIADDLSSQGHQYRDDPRGTMDATVCANILAITKPISPSDNTKGDERHFTDRVLSCMVMSPLGRSINEFDDIPQLLEAIRDAVKGHKDLHDKGILHQDVSAWNVMITEARKSDADPKGILIDLDLALELQDVFPDGRSCAGTPMFMAIEVLHSKHHTYRHDLESFLYVLLWIAVCNKSDELPEGSLLQRWRGHDNDQLAATKTHDMGLEGFENILREFHADFQDVKPLAWKLREILFRTSSEQGSLWTGTEKGDSAIEKIYGDFVGAIESSVAYHQARAIAGDSVGDGVNHR